MFKKIYNDFIIRKYKTDEIKNLVLLYAISIFLDKKIKDIEIVSANNLLYEIIEEKYDDISLNEEKLLAEHYLSMLKEKLILYKNDDYSFEMDKIKVLNNLKKNENKINAIKKIIKSDNEISPEEKDFLQQIKELL